MLSFLKNIIKDEVLIINTNLGLEIYYNSSIDYGNIITKSFLLLISKKDKMANDYRIAVCSSLIEVTKTIKLSFVRLSTMPLLFSSYTKSLLFQLNSNFLHNTGIMKELYAVLHETLVILNHNEFYSKKTYDFQTSVQELFKQIKYYPLLNQLIKESTSILRVN
ncbi:hypothetical protein [Urechidicola croceus]|nr:hypothetical protein [Urechidicola croceus]